jgi:hypothetical protein
MMLVETPTLYRENGLAPLLYSQVERSMAVDVFLRFVRSSILIILWLAYRLDFRQQQTKNNEDK